MFSSHLITGPGYTVRIETTKFSEPARITVVLDGTRPRAVRPWYRQPAVVVTTPAQAICEVRRLIAAYEAECGRIAAAEMWHDLCQRSAAEARGLRDAAALLRIPEARELLRAAVRDGKQYSAALDYYATRPVIGAARAMIAHRMEIAELRVRQTASPMTARRADIIRVRAAIAAAIGEETCGLLVDADVATCLPGCGGQTVVDWDRYAEKWHRAHGPSKYAAAGSRVEGRAVVVADSRGREVGRWALPARTLGRDPERVADAMLRRTHDAALTRAFGGAGADDRSQIAAPYIVCRGADPESRSAAIITSAPAELVSAWVAGIRSRHTSEPVVQVVVTDPAHGTRCHLTVPARFGAALAGRERAKDRIRAAIAWTFGREPAAYAPAISA